MAVFEGPMMRVSPAMNRILSSDVSEQIDLCRNEVSHISHGKPVRCERFNLSRSVKCSHCPIKKKNDTPYKEESPFEPVS